ncbi:peroxiredoxin [Blastochloris viridis]|uniref:Glutathione-dependent peroxiredoxin n=1 Tax=Blastochloris viridis TaxID=1079 RepID=A0A0H5B9G7_BLAVI|nr:peroxiredoxin [Blastochloris viridis]ALK07896.1 Putative peroxiredoxin [Blastochloris viridis]BAR98855.1 peroxiredoxin [Blastochloris viridis]CUU43818.1 Putative peroxiredoxin [Blastochloris viridis]
MAIKVGDRLPDVTFRVPGEDGPAAKTTAELFEGRKVVLFAVPGAFTPTCHKNHLPGYLARAADFKAKGVDAIMVTAVNDPFVMAAWANASGAEGKIAFLADGSAEFARAVGLELDASAFGMGIRSKRYAMVVDDGAVTVLSVEDTPSKAEQSSAETLLKHL